MLIKRIYYQLKPLIPRRIQIALRREVIQKKRSSYKNVWPIDERACKPPDGWSGWPEGKQFSLVLTHDVESAHGQDKCCEVMKLERELGFRSSFNLIPEKYGVSPDLRRNLTCNGFEVGVHGLYHDGKLYKSRKIFESRSIRINYYLKEWKATGFRSPSMHKNLEWIQDLDIEYDSSTFDTDPFEPESEGAVTIFPFSLSNESTHKECIELPYTLPQDFTLFILMKEETIDVWKRKLDWVAEHGGMALLNTHPDYMDFYDEKPKKEEYPCMFYKEFLHYVKSKYDGHYWHVLPRDIARFWKKNKFKGNGIYSTDRKKTIICVEKPSENKKRKPQRRVCMITYSFYDEDNRVRRYAETLIKQDYEVDVLSLRQRGYSEYETVKGVNVYRIQKRVYDEKQPFSYLTKLVAFCINASVFLSKKQLRIPYDVIHVHNMPDFLVFAAWLPKMNNSKIILDIHDIVPEFYARKFGTGQNRAIYRLLLLVERLSITFSDHVIVSNDIWYEKLINRCVKKEKCTVILNYPDPSMFYRRFSRRRDGYIRILYPGSLNWHQGIDIAINAFALIKDEFPEMEFHIYGDGEAKSSLISLVSKLKLGGRILFKESVSIDRVADVMANGDIGVVPKRADSFGNEAFSTKILEFMGVGVPVIVSDTKIDRYYFDESMVKFFQSENEKDLARCLVLLIEDQELRDRLVANAFKYIEKRNWEVKKGVYLDLLEGLLA